MPGHSSHARRGGCEEQRVTVESGRPSLADQVADELICPITMELPIDPVMAEDSFIYERWAIEELIKLQGEDLRSPTTNKPIGPQLLPAIQTRNTIEHLVRSGQLSGRRAKCWEERIENEQLVAQMKDTAESGDSEAMHLLGRAYYKGLHGLKIDKKKAYTWFQKAAQEFYPPGMASAGVCQVCGVGTEESISEGLVMLSIAAVKDGGSDIAAYRLGIAYAKERYGLRHDEKMSRYWLEKVVSGGCQFKHLDCSSIEKAREIMNMLLDCDDAERPSDC